MHQHGFCLINVFKIHFEVKLESAFSFAAGNPVAMTTKGGLEMKDGGSTGCLGTWIQTVVIFVAHDSMFIAP